MSDENAAAASDAAMEGVSDATGITLHKGALNYVSSRVFRCSSVLLMVLLVSRVLLTLFL